MMAPLPTTAHVHMTAKKTLYLANPYGFSAQQRGGPLHALVRALESMGADVWEPFARNNQIDWASAGWAYQIGQADLRDVRAADGLFAVVNGCPPDEGVMVELGLAIAWEKPVFLFRDDFRRCTDSEVYPRRTRMMEPPAIPVDDWEAAWKLELEETLSPKRRAAGYGTTVAAPSRQGRREGGRDRCMASVTFRSAVGIRISGHIAGHDRCAFEPGSRGT